MESRIDEPETINVWELMSGIDVDDVPSPTSMQFPAFMVNKHLARSAALAAKELMPDVDDDAPSPTSMQFPGITVNKHMSLSAALAATLSEDSLTVEEPSYLRPKAQWRPSHKGDSIRGKSKACAQEELTSDMALRQVKSSSLDAPSSKGSSLFGTVSGSKTSSFESLADNLQRSLSFRLAFSKENECILALEDGFYPQHSKAFSGDHFTDAPTNFSIHGSSDGQSSRSLSGQSLSVSAKVKKWFKSTKRTLKQHTSRKSGSKRSGPDKAQPRKFSSEESSRKASGHEDVQSKKLSSESETSYAALTSPFNGSRREGSSDLFVLNCVSNHRPYELDQHRIVEAAPICQHPHSFTPANKQLSSEESTRPPLNRPCSWEPQKVASDSGVKPVLYSTNSGIDINAYEDSNAVRAILMSLVGSAFDEKNVLQHPHYEQELKKGLNLPVVIVPTVLVRGKYIAGIDSIMQLFKKGTLGSILSETLPHGLKPNSTCICRGGKFLICPLCKGTRKLVRQGEETVSCRHCIGTGLLKCPSCPKE